MNAKKSPLPIEYSDREFKMHISSKEKGHCAIETLTAINNSIQEHQLNQAKINEFVENGFIYCDSIIAEEARDACRSYIAYHYAPWLRQSRRNDDWRMHFMLKFANNMLSDDGQQHLEVEHAPVLDVLLQSPALLAKCAAIMQAPLTGCFYNQVALRTPAPEEVKARVPEYAVGAEYHLDGQANSAGIRFPDPWSLLIGIALQDIDPGMGEFTVFRGSHTCRDWSSYPVEKMAKTLPSLPNEHRIVMKAGDAVLCHALLAHRGGKNCTTDGRTREMVFFRLQFGSNAHSAPVIDAVDDSLVDYIYSEERKLKLLSQPFAEYRGIILPPSHHGEEEIKHGNDDSG